MPSKFALLVFAVLAASTIPTAAAADWVAFQDPIERAFTMEVPKGWMVKGGMFRLGYSDYRPMADMTSPDGKINVRLGDVSIPTYALPAPNHSQEGSVVDLGAQAQMTVARYHPGQDYAAIYAMVRFRGVCASRTPLPASGAPPVPLAPEEAAVTRSDFGDAAYSCDGTRTAYVFARTALYQAFWQVHQLASFVAPQEQVAVAREVVEHGVRSFKLADAWIQYQKKLDQDALVYQQARQQNRRRALAQQVAQFEMQMQAMQGQVANFERGQARQGAQVEGWGNILTGITPTVDPLGNPRNVWTGSKSGYWADGKGNVINSDLSPGAGWQQLTPKQ